MLHLNGVEHKAHQNTPQNIATVTLRSAGGNQKCFVVECCSVDVKLNTEVRVLQYLAASEANNNRNNNGSSALTSLRIFHMDEKKKKSSTKSVYH